MEAMQTVRQWSLQSGIPYRTILAAAKGGDLPSLQFKERGQIFVTTADFEQWVEDARLRAASPDESQQETSTDTND